MADYLLDTNVLILHLRKRPQITALLTRWGEEGALYISVVTRTEILAGMHPHEEERTMELLDSLTNLAVDKAIADHAGRLIYQYARQGIQLSFPDALISATALHHDLTLSTTNPKHFPMPELRLHPLDVE
ncbi:MAG: type II toxin-antitoxin system VapC family toxin [Anaerolineae bacterium]|nr:type II toxin-antitoxin system VapC family toxin [Anaerolineae bacterium]